MLFFYVKKTRLLLLITKSFLFSYFSPSFRNSACPLKRLKLLIDTLFKNYLQVDEYTPKHTLFEGGFSEVIQREVIERGHVAAVLLYDSKLHLQVLTKQIRPAAFAVKNVHWWNDDFSPWMVECVAGIIKEGESPEVLCYRESLEEANCQVSELQFYTNTFPHRAVLQRMCFYILAG